MVVVPLKRGRGGNRHLKSPDEMDLEEVQCMTTITVSLRRNYSPVKKFASPIDFDCMKPKLSVLDANNICYLTIFFVVLFLPSIHYS